MIEPGNEQLEIDETEALEKAQDAVIQDLPERKRKKYERKNWGERPENLRKPIGQMSNEEKKQFRLWQAGEVIEKQKEKSAYDETEIYALGCFLLPVLCSRMPNPIPPTSEELVGFGRVITPLANKYLGTMQYKEEFNAGIFVLAFILPRLRKENSNTEYQG